MDPKFLAILTSFTLYAGLMAEPITGHLKKLDADNFTERNKAQLELAAWAVDNSDDAIELFFEEYKAAATPEVKLRVGQLLRERVLFTKYGRPQGFVGIRMNNGAEKIEGKSHAVVLVKNVIKGSPAEIFGLKQGDAVWRIDKQTFNRNAFASLQFREIVTAKREKDSVVIDLIRNGRPMEIKLVLGTMPIDFKRMNNRRLQRDPELDKENYFNNWLQKKMVAERTELKSTVK